MHLFNRMKERATNRAMKLLGHPGANSVAAFIFGVIISKKRTTAREATNTVLSTTKSSADTFSPETIGQPTFDHIKDCWLVPQAGHFKHKKEYNFFDGIPDGLSASNYVVYDTCRSAPYNHEFEPKNVYVDETGDFLNLLVPAVRHLRQGMNISSAEVVSAVDDILYGSFRVTAILSQVPGTCQGIFFYKSDSQEIDIEYLSDRASEGNNIGRSASTGKDPIPLWYANQKSHKNALATQGNGSAPNDVTAVHEYRIDWTKTHTAFFIDGEFQGIKYTANIPSKPGSFILNHWSNGDRCPPKEDSIMKIQNMTLYYNRASDKSSN